MSELHRRSAITLDSRTAMIVQTRELANGPTCLPAVYQHLNYLYYKNWLNLNKTRESEPGRVSMTRTMLGRDLMGFKYAELAIILYG